MTRPFHLGLGTLLAALAALAPAAVPQAKNALWGVDYVRGVARPVDKRPGVYEIAIPLGDRRTFLDDTFGVRVVVANADKTQATFQDFAVSR